MKKKILLLTVVIVAIIAVTCGYININNQFPASIIEKAGIGDDIEFQDDIQISVDKCEILSDEEKDKIYDKIGSAPFYELKIMEVTVTLENQSQEKKTCPMTDMYIESTGFSNGISKNIIDTSTDYYGSLSQELQPGERKQIIIPYEILSNQFSKEGWKEIENREFWLTFTSYPEKKILELD